jgi:hypothetical protein
VFAIAMGPTMVAAAEAVAVTGQGQAESTQYKKIANLFHSLNFRF